MHLIASVLHVDKTDVLASEEFRVAYVGFRAGGGLLEEVVDLAHFRKYPFVAMALVQGFVLLKMCQ